jgi:hypothetical protein
MQVSTSVSNDAVSEMPAERLAAEVNSMPILTVLHNGSLEWHPDIESADAAILASRVRLAVAEGRIQAVSDELDWEQNQLEESQ